MALQIPPNGRVFGSSEPKSFLIKTLLIFVVANLMLSVDASKEVKMATNFEEEPSRRISLQDVESESGKLLLGRDEKVGKMDVDSVDGRRRASTVNQDVDQ